MQESALISDFIAFCEFERKLSRRTTQAYMSDLGDFLLYCRAKNIEVQFTEDRLRKFLQYLFEERMLSASTVTRRMASIRLYCRYAAEKGDFYDPFIKWKPNIKKVKKLPRFLSCAEVSSLYATAAAMDSDGRERASIYILIIVATGLRISEFCSVRACDISDDGDSIRIFGKGQKERVVYIANKRLAEFLKKVRSEKFRASDHKAYVFVNQRGGPLSPQVFRRELASIVKRAHLDSGVTPHSLRHTAATMLIEQGIDIRIVQKILGHASISTTEIYTHVSDNLMRHAVKSANVIGRVTML